MFTNLGCRCSQTFAVVITNFSCWHLETFALAFTSFVVTYFSNVVVKFQLLSLFSIYVVLRKMFLLCLLNDFVVTFVGHLYFFVVSQPPPPPPPPPAPQPIPLPPTATISHNPSVLELALLKCKHCRFCAPVFVFCTRNKHGGARQSSRYGRVPCTAVMIMVDVSSLEHVLKCLTRQNVLTELTLDSSLESLDMFFFLEQLPLLTTHVPECLVYTTSYVTSPKTHAQSISH